MSDAPSVLQICRQALAHVGVTQYIDSLEHDSEGGRACKLFYAHVRDVLLTEIDWPFATKTATLNQISGFTPLRRAYGYTLPTDCLRVREVWTGTVSTRPADRYAFEFEDRSGVRVLVSDESEVKIVYTAQSEDPIQWSPSFRDALAWGLAVELAIALEKGGPLLERAERRYEVAKTRAMALTVGELTPEPDPDPPEIALR